MSKPLHNYLRAFRRGAGLTQKEVAFLLGLPTASQVSRLEHAVREPNLKILLALELLFRTPGRRLFAGVQDDVERRTQGRARRLLARMERRNADARQARKRETLEALLADPGDDLGLPT
ncbi:MAG: helix-turn-helix transcriptional regulator [Candidatus Omnitrophica bacterium]|nr:hypothetical protein [bacterium]NUN97420.1 helix-turn-helix transcriptional regulator [Candidatus Omnitrophota bacterium]